MSIKINFRFNEKKCIEFNIIKFVIKYNFDGLSSSSSTIRSKYYIQLQVHFG